MRSHFTALRRRLEVYPRGLHRNSKDERTVTTACLETCCPNWVATARPANKDRYARNSSWPGAMCAPQKAEYICADLSSRPQLFSCSRTADHTYTDTWYKSSRKTGFSATDPGMRYTGVADDATIQAFVGHF